MARGRAPQQAVVAEPAGTEREVMEQRILEGALRALGRHGSDKLRMNAVSAAAGVARGTVYRYFPTKTALLEALVGYERQRFAAALGTAVAEDPDGDRLEVVFRFVQGYLAGHPALQRLLDDEPGFVLAYLREQLPFLLRTTQRVAGGAISRSEVVRTGVLSDADVVELLLHVLLANFLAPGPAPERVTNTFKALLGARAAR